MDISQWPGRVRLEPTTTLRDALLAVDLGAVSAALVTNSRNQLLGLITDGDVRRALLSGAELGDSLFPLVQRSPLTVNPLESRLSVLDLMQAHQISVVPVIDEDGILIGVHLLHELIGKVNRSNTCLILAGGKGTRLGEITAQIPKPMVAVAGRPILERLLLHMVSHGIKNFVISVGHLGNIIEEYFQSGENHGCSIKYVRDAQDNPLGTGGPLALVSQFVENTRDALIVVNGDLVTQADVSSLISSHERTEADITIAVHKHDYQVPYGVIDTDDGVVVNGISEKPKLSWPISAGLYVMNLETIQNLRPGEALLVTDFLINQIQSGRRIHMWNIDSSWIDIGTPTELARARGQS
jgi:dTDP-glucose pyrophosphorylase/CBS domain-containing protein